jgi:predicted RND superfamily exporter protein
VSLVLLVIFLRALIAPLYLLAASALALAAGFVVLVVSPVPMVRDFGLVCGLDLALATIAVLALLPPMARAWLK